jgi:hypothetical protein
MDTRITRRAAILLLTSLAGALPAAAQARRGAVKVVPHTALQALLPALPGWQRNQPQGETDTEESVSRVTVDYNKGTSTLSFEFMDSSMDEDVLALTKEAIKGQNPEMKPMTLGGFPGAEEWFKDSLRGTVSVLVAGRFIVGVTGEGVPDLATVRRAAEAIDFQKMAALK